ncbi:hypothetical protein [Orenia marismortui]|uniref:hypothetical protein n=1 Tax=Orenia marismortui TaxID=46469 RepID=UPI000366638D|nr:hypothetical protein [Orenia marismortui]
MNNFNKLDEMIINFKKNVQLSVHQGILEHLMEITEENKRVKIKKIKEEMKNKKSKEKIINFVNESIEVFRKLTINTHGNTDNPEDEKKKDEVRKEYLADKEIYLIVDFPESGGNYLEEELSRAFGQKLEKSISWDNLPDENFIINESDDFLGWREPANYWGLVFQLCQFIVYINWTNQEKVVIKNNLFVNCLILLDEIFGNSVNYLVPVRHPAAIALSKYDNLNKNRTNPSNDSNIESYIDKITTEWEKYYLDIARIVLANKKIVPILFSEIDEFLIKLFEEINFSGSPTGLKLLSKEDHNIYQQEEITKKIQKVELLWDLNGIDFPIPKELL